MPDRFTCLKVFKDALASKCARVLNMAWLYMQVLYRVLNMSEYGSLCLNNTRIWLSMP